MSFEVGSKLTASKLFIRLSYKNQLISHSITHQDLLDKHTS